MKLVIVSKNNWNPPGGPEVILARTAKPSPSTMAEAMSIPTMVSMLNVNPRKCHSGCSPTVRSAASTCSLICLVTPLQYRYKGVRNYDDLENGQTDKNAQPIGPQKNTERDRQCRDQEQASHRGNAQRLPGRVFHRNRLDDRTLQQPVIENSETEPDTPQNAHHRVAQHRGHDQTGNAEYPRDDQR